MQTYKFELSGSTESGTNSKILKFSSVDWFMLLCLVSSSSIRRSRKLEGRFPLLQVALGTSEISLSTLRLRLRRINKIYSWQRRFFRQKRKSIKRMWKIIPKRDIFVSRFFVLDVLWRWKISRIFWGQNILFAQKKWRYFRGGNLYGKKFLIRQQHKNLCHFSKIYKQFSFSSHK